jgi:hypothetical protein
MYLFRGLGGYWNLWFSSRSLQRSGFWRGAFNRHGFRDRGPPDLCFCHHKPYDVSTGGYDYLRQTASSRCTYLPLWWLPVHSLNLGKRS